MCKRFTLFTVLMGLLAVQPAVAQNTTSAETKLNVTVSAEELARLRSAIEANPNDPEAHQAFLEAFTSADAAESQYRKWIEKYPESAIVPLALAEKYGVYSPKRRQYLLKAAERQPDNAEIWQKLALDAAFRGGGEKRREYLAKAIAVTDPDSVDLIVNLKRSYASLLRYVNEALWREKIWELVENFPNEPTVVAALSMLAYNTADIEKKIDIYEELRRLFLPAKNLHIYSAVAMTRLVNAYIRTGQDAKAIELAAAMADKAAERLLFPEKLKLAKALVEMETKVKEGDYSAAKDMAMSLTFPQSHLFNIGNRIVLLRASLLEATGSTRAAYDSLLTFQAETPDDEVKAVLEQYGSKLNKNKSQIADDLRAAIAKNARPAPPFELEVYGSDKKVKLEDYKGKVVLLTFWYPGCGPCRAEMPHFENVVKNYDKDELVYLGVNGIRDQDEFVLPFMKTSKYSFMPLGGREDMLKDYNVRYYPTNFIIDQDGKIVYFHFMINANNERMLDLMLQSLVQGD